MYIIDAAGRGQEARGDLDAAGGDGPQGRPPQSD